jgi:hypothetical protein
MKRTQTQWQQAKRAWAIANAGKPKVVPKTKLTIQERTHLAKHKHDQHPVEVRPGKAHNAGQLFCVECQKHIQWLSQQDYDFLLAELKQQ